jgi:hypothetical protein
MINNNYNKNDFEALIDIIKLQFVYIEALQMIKNEELFVSIEKLELALEQINRLLPDVDPTTELKHHMMTLKDYVERDLTFVTEFTSSTPIINSSIDDFDTSEEMNTTTIFNHIFSYFICCGDKKGKDALIHAKNQEIENLQTKVMLLHAHNKSLLSNRNKTKVD